MKGGKVVASSCHSEVWLCQYSYRKRIYSDIANSNMRLSQSCLLRSSRVLCGSYDGEAVDKSMNVETLLLCRHNT